MNSLNNLPDGQKRDILIGSTLAALAIGVLCVFQGNIPAVWAENVSLGFLWLAMDAYSKGR